VLPVVESKAFALERLDLQEYGGGCEEKYGEEEEELGCWD
jgi:hypothetical protein